MKRVFVRDLAEHVGEYVKVCGWVDTRRMQRAMQFVLVRDHTGTVQVTKRRTACPDGTEATLEVAPPESAIEITGLVKANAVVKLGGLELIPDHVNLVNPAETPLPIDENSGSEARLDWRFLDVRRPVNQLLFEVESTVESAMRGYAFANGAIEMHTPKLMGGASESGSEVFKVQYFDRAAFLAQSPQFYKQMAISAGIDRFFEIGPVFRAEPSFTARHATEFTGIDVELAWIESVEDVMCFEEAMLVQVIETVKRTLGTRIKEVMGVEVRVPTLPFPRLTMSEVRDRLGREGWRPEKDRGDLDTAGERRISELIQAQLGHEFLFITEYPATVRPFYHMRPEGRPKITCSFDLLWKGIEITTGAQREHRHELLLRQAKEKQLDLDSMQAYLDSFRFGTPPHGGLGAGLARIIMVMLGLESIRQATFLYRGPHRLSP